MHNTINIQPQKLKKNDFIFFHENVSKVNFIKDYNSEHLLLNYSYKDITTNLAIKKNITIKKILS